MTEQPVEPVQEALSKADHEEMVYKATINMLTVIIGVSILVYGLYSWISSLLG